MQETKFSMSAAFGGWPKIAEISPEAPPTDIPAGHTLHLSPRVVHVSGRGYCIDPNAVFMVCSSNMMLRSYKGGPFRAQYRKLMRWWWTVTTTLVTKHWRRLGRRGAARNARYILRHANHALLNELTGYYGKRRRGYSYDHRVLWKVGLPRQVRVNIGGTRTTRIVAHADAHDMAHHVRATLRKFGLDVTVMSEEDREATVWHYTNGMCYKLFLMLRQVYPDAELWYDHVVGHVYTRIGEHWYDIRGEHRNRTDLRPLDHRSGHKPHRWKGVSASRRTYPVSTSKV